MDNGVILIKYWFEVSADEQAKRFEGRMTDPRKHWKLSPMDLEGQSKWYDYSRAKDAMFMATDTTWAPWHVVNSDDKNAPALTVFHTCSASSPMRISLRKARTAPSSEQ